ncbi:MAG: low temperature requirement protein A [Acidimicrobiales bacterium]
MAGRNHTSRFETARRHEERVTPLELFFDLVFVLAITQCTALMAANATWEGIGQGLVVLGLLWWSWVGYAWLTSVVDPEEGAVRVSIFLAMAALLVASLGVPDAFGDLGPTFAVAYAFVRFAHIALFVLASRGDAHLRRSVTGLAVSTAIAVGIVAAGSFLEGMGQVAFWLVALLLDMGGPFLFGSEGWKLVPGHFAERHGLIVIIALGESIVAIGVGAEAGVDGGVVAAAIVGMALAATLWWAYFDAMSSVVARHLGEAVVGGERNRLARDAYSFLHFPMVAGIVLVALGLKTTLAHVGDPLDKVAATALLGGVALYLLGLVGFAWRDHLGIKSPRLIAAGAVLCVLPASGEMSALVTVSVVTVVMGALTLYENRRYAEHRQQIRRPRETPPGGPSLEPE